jgi:hypothetical protein
MRLRAWTMGAASAALLAGAGWSTPAPAADTLYVPLMTTGPAPSPARASRSPTACTITS